MIMYKILSSYVKVLRFDLRYKVLFLKVNFRYKLGVWLLGDILALTNKTSGTVDKVKRRNVTMAGSMCGKRERHEG